MHMHMHIRWCDTIAPMKRTSILLDPGLLAELERLARREGVPTSQVIRRALQEYVAAREPAVRDLPGFVGIGRGPGDVADRVEEILAGETGGSAGEPDPETDR